LFTKELEVAMLAGEADLAVHSLKDLPTELPPGLKLGAASKREDVRDALLFAGPKTGHPHGMPPGSGLRDAAPGSTIATSSARRQAQLLALRPDLKTVPIRGNVGTRIHKLLEQTELSGIILALAGLKRLGFQIREDGQLQGNDVPSGIYASVLSTDQMLPCVGQAALGIEIRENDPLLDSLCAKLNDPNTWHAVLAERAFLRGMGGGCLSPVAAFAETNGNELFMRALSFRNEQVKQAEGSDLAANAAELGLRLARELDSKHA
jgi:hydroxymethylbilane synthase